MIVLLAVLAALAAAAGSLYLASRRTGVVPMPSSRSARLIVVEAISLYASRRPVVELGSGWGGLARKIAWTFPDRRIYAFERSTLPYSFSRLFSLLLNTPNLVQYRADFGESQLRDLAVYVAYLSGESMKQLRQQFERDRPRDGVLISCAFAMPGWTPVRTVKAADFWRTPVYIYEY